MAKTVADKPAVAVRMKPKVDLGKASRESEFEQ